MSSAPSFPVPSRPRRAGRQVGIGSRRRWITAAVPRRPGCTERCGSGMARRSRSRLRRATLSVTARYWSRSTPRTRMALSTSSLTTSRATRAHRSRRGSPPIPACSRCSSRSAPAGSISKKPGGASFVGRRSPGRPSPTRTRSLMPPASPRSSSTAGRSPGSGDGRRGRLAIVAAPSSTAFEERRSKW
jgi:hypothetical protein